MGETLQVSQSILQALAEQVPHFGRRAYLVAVSGGLDSMVLLHALARVASGRPGMRVRCACVDHGLQPQAAQWSDQVKEAAAAAGVAFLALRCEGIAAGKLGLQAAARQARYELLRSVLQSGEVLVTAHHQDDQAETVMLQMLRGAGIAGLSAMPALAPFPPGLLLRPLLDQSREMLARYATKHRLHWIDDPSNASLSHDRNYLRHAVLPAVRSRWPAVDATLGRLAATCADTQQVLDSAARRDLQGANDADAGLHCDRVRMLVLPRARNLLRYWLRRQGFAPPPRGRLEAIMRNVVTARSDAQPLVGWDSCEVRRYRDHLYAMRPLGPAPQASLDWSAGETAVLPDGSQLLARRCTGAGISASALHSAASLQVTWRRGGERIMLPGHAHHSSLKNLLQQHGVLPWMRARLPIVLVNGELAAVATLFLAKSFAARKGEAGYHLEWRGAPPFCASPQRAV